jgi:hypothetical protein
MFRSAPKDARTASMDPSTAFRLSPAVRKPGPAAVSAPPRAHLQGKTAPAISGPPPPPPRPAAGDRALGAALAKWEGEGGSVAR